MTVRLPDLVDLNEQEALQGQHPDDGVEYIMSFDTTLVVDGCAANSNGGRKCQGQKHAFGVLPPRLLLQG